METFGKIMTIIFMVIVSTIVRGFVLVKLWAWFMVTIFNLDPLRIIEAIGIMFVINFIIAKNEDERKFDSFTNVLTDSIGWLIGTCGVALLFGWIVFKLM